MIPNIFKSLFLSDFCNVWLFRDGKDKKNGVTSNVILRFSGRATGPSFGSSDLKGQSEMTINGMPQIQTKQWNGLDLILMRLHQ